MEQSHLSHGLEQQQWTMNSVDQVYSLQGIQVFTFRKQGN